MRPRKKFTTAIVSQIERWVQEGCSAQEIAQKIGCTLGTLRVRCSQFGISLRPAKKIGHSPSLQADGENGSQLNRRPIRGHAAEARDRLVLVLPRGTLERLRKHAKSKGLSDDALIATLLEKIAEDDLYEAVLDDSW